MNSATQIHPKVISAATVGAVVTIGTAIASAFGHPIPDVVGPALVTLLSALAGYFTPSNTSLT